MQRAGLGFFQTTDNRDVMMRIFSFLSTANLLSIHTVSKRFSMFAADNALWREKIYNDFNWTASIEANPKQFYQTLCEEKERAVCIYSYEALRYLIRVPYLQHVNKMIIDSFPHNDLVQLQNHAALSDHGNNLVDVHKKDVKPYFDAIKLVLDAVDHPIVAQLKSLVVACVNNLILLNFPISEQQEELFCILQDCKNNSGVLQLLYDCKCEQLIYIATSKQVAIDNNAMDIDCGNITKP